MPSRSHAAKRQPGAANQRDTRHEGGIVRPGKRIQKQKSNGQLHPPPSTTPPPLTSTPPQLNGHGAQSVGDDDGAGDQRMRLDTRQRTSYADSSCSESCSTPGTVGGPELHRQIDVNATKNPAVHQDVGLLSFALTVLRSCPLYDTIAILIVLLQIPPVFLSMIQILFAALTFVPPATSTMSGLSLMDIFDGAFGTPSVATIIVADFLILLVWLFLWSPAQDVALDLAQIVIALTLGGGTTGRDTAARNGLVCMGVIGFSHLARRSEGRGMLLDSVLFSGQGFFRTSDPDDPLEKHAARDKSSARPGWLRTMIAIHILSQGMVRYIRDWYVRREKRDGKASSGDPEAAKGFGTEGSVDGSTPVTQTSELDLNTPTTGHAPSIKKKKKQSALVRIRQPLWAALASTKIVMVKEYEGNHLAADHVGSHATDIDNLGDAPFTTEAECVWLSHIGSDKISFGTSHFDRTERSTSDEKQPEIMGIDRSRPIYVKVNDSVWQPTRMVELVDSQSDQGIAWTGEVFGLAPLSAYEINFLSTRDDRVLFSASVRTLATEAQVVVSPNPAANGRPGSPTTILRTSIATSESKLVEERSRMRRDRKDQKTKVNALRREIDKLNHTISTSGSQDDRLRQKVHQSHAHMRAAEEFLSSTSESSTASSVVPSGYEKEKSTYNTARSQRSKAQNAYERAKTAAEQSLSTLRTDLNQIQLKRDRINARIGKLSTEHERMTDAAARDQDEAARIEARDAERRRMEVTYSERLQAGSTQVAQAMAALKMLYQEVESAQAFEAMQLRQQRHHVQQSPAPSYAETEPAGQTVWYTPMMSHSQLASPMPGSAGLVSGGHPNTPWSTSNYHAATNNGTLQHTALDFIAQRRARSSSLLSDSEAFSPAMPMDANGHAGGGEAASGGGAGGKGAASYGGHALASFFGHAAHASSGSTSVGSAGEVRTAGSR